MLARIHKYLLVRSETQACMYYCFCDQNSLEDTSLSAPGISDHVAALRCVLCANYRPFLSSSLGQEFVRKVKGMFCLSFMVALHFDVANINTFQVKCFEYRYNTMSQISHKYDIGTSNTNVYVDNINQSVIYKISKSYKVICMDDQS